VREVDVTGPLDALELTSRLIAVPGMSGAEADVADEIEAAMRSAGFRDVWRDPLGSVVGIAGPEGDAPVLLFDGHMDVVPAVGDWTVDPFQPLVSGGRLYGRGSTDMKAGLAAAIAGVAAAAASGRLLGPVAVSATVLEETVEGVALARVLDDIRPEAVVICEPSDLAVQVGQRGRAELVVTVSGTPAHAAYPERGKNPITLAASGLAALERLALPADPDLGLAILVATDVISQPWPSISLIPSGVQIRFDRRTLVGETREDVLGAIVGALANVDAEAFDVSITATPLSAYTGVGIDAPRWLPAWRTDPGHWLALTASEAARRVTGAARTGVYDFCTNGSESAGARGMPTIGLGPGLAADAHTPDESVLVTQVRYAEKIYEQLAINAAGRRADASDDG
jgi:putative selenium metabolism hydrolase